MSTKARRLQNVYLVARDVGAQCAFYEGILGLPVKFRDGERWAQYDAGGPGFAIACTEEARPAEAGAVLVFEVDHFDGVEESVVSAGGRVEGRRDMGSHGTVLSLRDPEGNIVQMFRRAPKPH
jgi:predicted enzyme related to lactoylglutathione lyase